MAPTIPPQKVQMLTTHTRAHKTYRIVLYIVCSVAFICFWILLSLALPLTLPLSFISAE